MTKSCDAHDAVTGGVPVGSIRFLLFMSCDRHSLQIRLLWTHCSLTNAWQPQTCAYASCFFFTHIHTTPFTQAHHRHWVTDSLCLASYYPFSLLSMKRRRSVRQRSPASLPYSTPPDTVPALSSVSATVVLNRFRLRLMSSCSAAPLRFTHWSEVWWGCVTTVVWAAAFIWTEWGGKTGERGREEQLSFHFD